MRECLDVLRLGARAHDPEPDENRKGVNIVIAGKAEIPAPKVRDTQARGTAPC